jgi:hypothetical protein
MPPLRCRSVLHAALSLCAELTQPFLQNPKFQDAARLLGTGRVDISGGATDLQSSETLAGWRGVLTIVAPLYVGDLTLPAGSQLVLRGPVVVSKNATITVAGSLTLVNTLSGSLAIATANRTRATFSVAADASLTVALVDSIVFPTGSASALATLVDVQPGGTFVLRDAGCQLSRVTVNAPAGSFVSLLHSSEDRHWCQQSRQVDGGFDVSGSVFIGRRIAGAVAAPMRLSQLRAAATGQLRLADGLELLLTSSVISGASVQLDAGTTLRMSGTALADNWTLAGEGTLQLEDSVGTQAVQNWTVGIRQLRLRAFSLALPPSAPVLMFTLLELTQSSRLLLGSAVLANQLVLQSSALFAPSCTVTNRAVLYGTSTVLGSNKPSARGTFTIAPDATVTLALRDQTVTPFPNVALDVQGTLALFLDIQTGVLPASQASRLSLSAPIRVFSSGTVRVVGRGISANGVILSDLLARQRFIWRPVLSFGATRTRSPLLGSSHACALRQTRMQQSCSAGFAPRSHLKAFRPPS